VKQNLMMTKKFLFNFKERERRHNGYLIFKAQISYTQYILLSPQHGASSGWGWKSRPRDKERSCKYIQ
jgi:hypothetical protein